MLKLIKVTQFVIALIGVASIFLHNYLYTLYAKSGCNSVEIVKGCIVEINNHGSISYITEGQNLTLILLVTAFVLFAGVAALMQLYQASLKKKSKD